MGYLEEPRRLLIAAPDWVAAQGMRMLAAPLYGDSPITSGESGAAPFGALSVIMTDDNYAELRKALKLDENSKVLVFSTEGDTDPDRYKTLYGKASINNRGTYNRYVKKESIYMALDYGKIKEAAQGYERI